MDLADAHGFGCGLGQFNAAALGHDVDVLARPVQEKIPDKSTNHKCTLPALVGEFADPFEDGVGKM